MFFSLYMFSCPTITDSQKFMCMHPIGKQKTKAPCGLAKDCLFCLKFFQHTFWACGETKVN